MKIGMAFTFCIFCRVHRESLRGNYKKKQEGLEMRNNVKTYISVYDYVVSTGFHLFANLTLVENVHMYIHIIILLRECRFFFKKYLPYLPWHIVAFFV